MIRVLIRIRIRLNNSDPDPQYRNLLQEVVGNRRHCSFPYFKICEITSMLKKTPSSDRLTRVLLLGGGTAEIQESSAQQCQECRSFRGHQVRVGLKQFT